MINIDGIRLPGIRNVDHDYVEITKKNHAGQTKNQSGGAADKKSVVELDHTEYYDLDTVNKTEHIL